MKIAAIVQARMGSSRLPGKVLRNITGKPMIELLLNRLSKSKKLDEIIVSTTKKIEDDKLNSVILSLGYKCFRGSEKDVLDRYYETAKKIKADVIVRITGDCPLIDPGIVDECIKSHECLKVDYFSNTFPPTYPDGLDVSVISFEALERANNEAKKILDREHVTSYMINSETFSKASIQYYKNLSHLRWTVDNLNDLNLVKKIFEFFSPDIHFKWEDILRSKIILT
jgi:glutamate-1-semialdehyde 2,1-aminomutase